MKVRTILGGIAIAAVAAITIPVQNANAATYWGYCHYRHCYVAPRHVTRPVVIVVPHRERHYAEHRHHRHDYR